MAVAASVAVGAVFVVAGASKLASGPAWRANATALGAPGWSIPLVPWVELAVGALLVVQVAPPWPAVVAVALLLAFSALIALRLRAGEHPVCACFGQWSASELGPRHLVRNGVLIAVAAIAALG